MAIPDEDVAKVRAATDIAALIGEHTALKRVGRRFVGLCPFHGEKTPSFSVNAEEGLYYCFGCQASGDAISFVRAVDGCDFVEAIEKLAARAGVTVRNDADPSAELRRGQRQKLYDAVERATAYYHEYLLQDKDAGPARHYLRSRGYDGEIVRKFKIGFAPAQYDALVRALRLPPTVLREAGLAYENSRGRLQDAFRERILFPIFDPGGRPIALGGRVLPDELRRGSSGPGPKYRNSPESPIYQKRATLYGLNWSKSEIAHSEEAIVCEGYTDVIGFHTAGIERAVATCGTALTEEHFQLLSRFAKRIVLCFDGDKAGRNAAARLYEWERRHQLSLFVAALPSGADPAELAREDPEALRQAIAGSRPFLGFQVDRALGSFDLHTPEGRTGAAELTIDAIAEHPNELVRDQYIIEVADRTHHDPARLRALSLDRSRAPREMSTSAEREGNDRGASDRDPGPQDDLFYGDSFDGDGAVSQPRGLRAKSSRVGRDGLLACIHRPSEVASLFCEELFVEPLERDAFVALAAALDLHDAISNAPDDVAALISRLAVTDGAEEIDIEGTFIEMARTAATRALSEVELSARRADAVETAEASTTSALIKQELELLRDPEVRPGEHSPAVDAATRLVAWLSSRQLETS